MAYGTFIKLGQNCFKVNLLAWISNYLSSRKQRVQIKSASSSLLSISAGIPQGSVLWPLLFLIYVHDIAENLHSLVRFFAEDNSLGFFSATNLRDIKEIIHHEFGTNIKWGEEMAS